MAQEFAPGVFRHDRAYARVSRIGRWTWRVRVMVPTSDGLGDATFDTTHVFGWRRVERMAKRLIERHIRRHVQRDGETFEVRRDFGDDGS